MSGNMVKEDNYINIQGWMVTELGLKGNELIIYACIHGFSQINGQCYHSSLQYLAEWTNTTKRAVINTLKSLTEKGLIIKTEKFINGVKFCEYVSLKCTSGEKSSPGGEESSLGGGEKSSPNNKDINNKYDNKTNITVSNDTVRQTDVQRCVNEWNSLAEYGIKQISRMAAGTQRYQRLVARIKQYGIDDVLKAIAKIRASSFLQGRSGSKRQWVITFDWFVCPNNFPKVLDGNYDDAEMQNPIYHTPDSGGCRQ